MLRALGRKGLVLLLMAFIWAGSAFAQTYEEGLKAFEAEKYDQAYRIWQPLADAGDPIAQYSLGKLFERGGGSIRQDFGQAARWYRSAAAQGVAAAQNNLALMHAQGRGTPRDVDQKNIAKGLKRFPIFGGCLTGMVLYNVTQGGRLTPPALRLEV